MSFFRLRSRIINQTQQPQRYSSMRNIVARASDAEPALFFTPDQRFASVLEIPPQKTVRVSIQPAARFPTMRRIMSRAVLNRGKTQ